MGFEDPRSNNTLMICPSCANPMLVLLPLIIPYPLPSESSLHRNNDMINRDQVTFDISVAEQEIGRLDQEMSRIQGMISRLEGAVATMKKRKDEVEKHTMNQRSLLAPIRKLPWDVLSYIYLTCQEVIDDGYITEDSVVRTIGQVSSYWRWIAQKTPRLWCRLRFDIDNEFSLRSWFLDCIKRSGELPLTIDVRLDEDDLDEGFIQSLAGCAHRIEHFQAKTSPNLLEAIVSHSPNTTTSFNGLKRLSMYVSDEYGTIIPSLPNLTHLSLELEYIDDSTVSFQSAAPSLTHLELIGDYHLCTFIDFPWTQITHFESEWVTFREGDLSTILELMKNLISLYLAKEELAISRPVILPNLTTLKLKQVDEPEDALGFLTAPNLQVLDMSDKFEVETSTIHAIMAFIQRSHCNLNELILRNVSFDEQWKTQQFRNVTKIRIVQWCDDDSSESLSQNLRWFNRTITGVDCLPRLEVLEISNLDADDLDEVIAVVKSRVPYDTEEGTQTICESSERITLVEVNISFSEDNELTSTEKWAQFVRDNRIKSHYGITNTREEYEAFWSYKPLIYV